MFSGVKTFIFVIAFFVSSFAMVQIMAQSTVDVIAEPIGLVANDGSSDSHTTDLPQSTEVKETKKVVIPTAKSVQPIADDQPVAAPTSDTPKQPAKPYSINKTAAKSDVSSLGYSLKTLQARSIQVISHNGGVPRRCATGTSGSKVTQGMAVRTNVTYTPCPDGTSPIYDVFLPAGYKCVVVYNVESSKKQAILAHELAHCLQFTSGNAATYRNAHAKMRDTKHLSSAEQDEVAADDYMICKHGLDTAWGAGSYYNRYGVDRPSTNQCSKMKEIADKYLF